MGEMLSLFASFLGRSKTKKATRRCTSSGRSVRIRARLWDGLDGRRFIYLLAQEGAPALCLGAIGFEREVEADDHLHQCL